MRFQDQSTVRCVAIIQDDRVKNGEVYGFIQTSGNSEEVGKYVRLSKTSLMAKGMAGKAVFSEHPNDTDFLKP